MSTRLVSTDDGDVVVVLGNKNDPPNTLRLEDGWPEAESYTIDRKGKYRHMDKPVFTLSSDSDSYRPRSVQWEADEEYGVVCGTPRNQVHLSVWSKLRALRIVLE